MIGPPSPYPDSVVSLSLGGGSTEDLAEDAATHTAADVLLPFDVQPGLQPHACVVMKNGSRITAWAVDTWAAGDVRPGTCAVLCLLYET